MKKVISLAEYESAMYLLKLQLQQNLSIKFDCIVCLKRSGFILGTYLSNQLNLPLFVPSEINSIPDGFKNILVVDDKIYSGKSMKKLYNKIHGLQLQKNLFSACLFVEGENFPVFYVAHTSDIVKMWYEI